MKYEIQCIICKKNQEDQELRCNNCDNLFAVFFEDYFDKKEILNERSMWRYAKMFPWIKNNNIVTLGEGGTPLIKDGNNIKEVIDGLKLAKSKTGNGKPVLILMHTVMGNGVDFMMHTHAWHGKAPNDEQLETALKQNPETLGDY